MYHRNYHLCHIMTIIIIIITITLLQYCYHCAVLCCVREDILKEKTFLSGIAQIRSYPPLMSRYKGQLLGGKRANAMHERKRFFLLDVFPYVLKFPPHMMMLTRSRMPFELEVNFNPTEAASTHNRGFRLFFDQQLC